MYFWMDGGSFLIVGIPGQPLDGLPELLAIIRRPGTLTGSPRDPDISGRG
jgi:hypothetical protein